MHTTHRFNSLHRVERWTGKYFALSQLWQTGCYLPVPHYEGVPLCPTLLKEIDIIKKHQRLKDQQEQDLLLNQSEGEHADLQESLPADGFANKFSANEFPTDECNDELLESIQPPILPNYMEEPTDNVQSGHEDVPMPGPTDALPQNNPAGVPAGAVLRETYHASYVRVVHTTGIHNLGMISCQCRGQELLPVDLMASHLVPASFQIIRTLFTVQVLDRFRFSNLEMKASAYQFFNMLRRITSPLVLGNIVDLHNEFWQMTRLWRWLKKLKWAGYGHKVEDPADEEGGKMTIFCPACPQHNVNLPKDWHE